MAPSLTEAELQPEEETSQTEPLWALKGKPSPLSVACQLGVPSLEMWVCAKVPHLPEQERQWCTCLPEWPSVAAAGALGSCPLSWTHASDSPEQECGLLGSELVK